MPTCRDCGHYGASAEFRRVPGGLAWICKDKVLCKMWKGLPEAIRKDKTKEKV